jgi:protein SCO1/2
VLRVLLLACLCIGLVACAPEPAKFNSTDITGAPFGEDFRLTDHNGHIRSLSDFKGSVVVVFFGFTHCPDVCPTTLSEMKAVRDQLGDKGKRMQVLFITLDPERDTPELLAQYVPSFDPSFLGLYGDLETTAATAKAFKVFYQKVPGSTPENYGMDHTAASYVYDPQGRLRLHVRSGMKTADVAQDIDLLLSGR